MIVEFAFVVGSFLLPYGFITIGELVQENKKTVEPYKYPYSREARKTLVLLEAVIRNDPAVWSCSVAIPGMDFTAIVKHKQNNTTIVFYNEKIVINAQGFIEEITRSMVSDCTYQSFFDNIVSVINTQGKAQSINDFNKIVAKIFSGEPGSMLLESHPEKPTSSQP